MSRFRPPFQAGEVNPPEGGALPQSAKLRLPEELLYPLSPLHSPLLFRFRCPPTAMAAAAAGPGAPLSPDELLPKGDAEKPEEELEEEDDEEVLSAAGQRGAGRCGQGVGVWDPRAAESGRRRLAEPGEVLAEASPGGGVRPCWDRVVPASGGGRRSFGPYPRLFHHS